MVLKLVQAYFSLRGWPKAFGPNIMLFLAAPIAAGFNVDCKGSPLSLCNALIEQNSAYYSCLRITKMVSDAIEPQIL